MQINWLIAIIIYFLSSKLIFHKFKSLKWNSRDSNVLKIANHLSDEPRGRFMSVKEIVQLFYGENNAEFSDSSFEIVLMENVRNIFKKFNINDSLDLDLDRDDQIILSLITESCKGNRMFMISKIVELNLKPLAFFHLNILNFDELSSDEVNLLILILIRALKNDPEWIYFVNRTHDKFLNEGLGQYILTSKSGQIVDHTILPFDEAIFRQFLNRNFKTLINLKGENLEKKNLK